MSAIPNALLMSGGMGTDMPNDSQFSSSRGPGAGWNGSPKASPNTKRPKRTDQTPPTAVTNRMRHQMLFGLSRIAATTPSAMNRAPYPTSPIMNPKKNGAAINRNNVGSSSW